MRPIFSPLKTGGGNMGLKRKPPENNVRRVAAIDNNSRYAITNKNGGTVQCESHSERRQALRFERDPGVKDYRSQPLRISYQDSDKKSHSYVPDFQVWRWDGSVEIHEVTLAERRLLPDIQRWEEGAKKFCEEKGWQYVVHKEDDLPNDSESSNLLFLYAFRPAVYACREVALATAEKLSNGKRSLLTKLIKDFSQELGLPIGMVSSGLYHLMWHGKIATDLCSLIFVDGAPLPRTLVWLPVKEG
jgi:hypothetical protein